MPTEVDFGEGPFPQQLDELVIAKLLPNAVSHERSPLESSIQITYATTQLCPAHVPLLQSLMVYFIRACISCDGLVFHSKPPAAASQLPTRQASPSDSLRDSERAA